MTFLTCYKSHPMTYRHPAQRHPEDRSCRPMTIGTRPTSSDDYNNLLSVVIPNEVRILGKSSHKRSTNINAEITVR